MDSPSEIDRITADQIIKRLLIVRDQIDGTIEGLKMHGVIKCSDHAPTGILLSGAKDDSEYSLVVFGMGNFIACQDALRIKAKENGS